MNSFSIKRLVSGGVITNYHCTSACRHCLYRSSPRRSKDYLAADKAGEIMRCIRNAGCRSVHIGGGEPFLDPESLVMVLAAAQQAGVGIEYVETNSSWFTSIDAAVDLLLRLKQQGLRTLLVSISPLHNEYIPYARTIGVINACQKTGLHVFPWTADFEADLDSFDRRKAHRLEEYSERFGSQYLAAVLRRYWIHTGGRALDLLRPLSPLRNADQILNENTGSCASELAETSHFHIDLYGRYVPGLCSGLAIDMNDLGKILSQDKYPLLFALALSGISGLYHLARKEFSYRPGREHYLNKCDLCDDIRTFLFENHPEQYDELHPAEFYIRN